MAIATHDEQLIGESLVRTASLEPGAYEFQMLLGVRESRADELRGRRPPAPRLRALRAAVVRVLSAATSGDPQMAGVIAKATFGEGHRPRLMVLSYFFLVPFRSLLSSSPFVLNGARVGGRDDVHADAERVGELRVPGDLFG